MKRSTAIGLQRAAAGREAACAADSQLNPISEDAVHRTAQASRGQRGFTVIEMIIVVSIAAILVSIAYPALMNMVRSSAVTSATNQLVASLNWARNQAVIQHATVRICKAANASTGSSATCDASAGSTGYEKGWLIFVDSNANGALDSGETLLKAVAPDNNNKITMNGSPSTAPHIELNVGFTPLGMLSGSSTTGTTSAFIVVCDDRAWARNGQYAKVIAISTTGRIATAIGTNQTAISGSSSSLTSTCTPS